MGIVLGHLQVYLTQAHHRVAETALASQRIRVHREKKQIRAETDTPRRYLLFVEAGEWGVGVNVNRRALGGF